jgi:MoxR-like ATPase
MHESFRRHDLFPAAPVAAPTTADADPLPVTAASEHEVAWFAAEFERMAANIGRAVKGKTPEVSLALVALFSEGHLLLEDVPGVGKTSLARAMAESISGTWRRIQFTPDLLPSDVTGVSIWNQSTGAFEFQRGPVFTNILIGDEINRASPKTQSALLEVMEERQVTVDGKAESLVRPFVVVATQNPIEMEGTYRLPEAQLDRFMVKLSLGYPDAMAEAEMVATRFGGASTVLSPVADLDQITRMITTSARVRIDASLVHYAVSIVNATRRSPDVRLGASPRGTLSLLRAAQTVAAAQGRPFVIADDLQYLLVPILAHRILVSPEASLRGVSPERVLDQLVRSVHVPTAGAGPAGLAA